MSDNHDDANSHPAGDTPAPEPVVVSPHVERTPVDDAAEPTSGSLSASLRPLFALICLAAGVVASILGAQAIANSDARSARSTFAQASAAAAAASRAAIAHQEDLRTSAATYLAANPSLTPAEFSSWTRWAHALSNYPALESLGVVSLVRADELTAFKARQSGHSSTASVSSTTTKTTGAQPFQCLSAASVSRNAKLQPSAHRDFCAQDATLLGSRDTTFTHYASVNLAAGPAIEEFTPVYRGTTPPKTGLGRRAAFAGWLRQVVNPNALLEVARQPVLTALSLTHTSSGSSSTTSLGSPQSGGQSTVSDLHAGWTLHSFAAPVPGGIFDDGDAIALLALGLFASLEAAVLILSFRFVRPDAPVASTAAEPAPAPLREDLYDSLTQLPNRGLTMDRAERMLARAGRNTAIMVGALFIDIDWFKDLNEKLGEEAGDQILKIVAERLQDVVRTHDTVGRYSGDEFVVIVESQVRGMRLDSLARRIIEALHKPVEIEGFGPSFCLTASIGVAFGRYATPEDLLRDAHMALFAAKAAGKDRYTLFNANMRSIIEGRGVLEVDLNRALEEDQFSLLYQPVYEISSQRVVAVEALLRWEHPTKGEVDPTDFIPLAEESGLIVPIGRWVLEEACARAAAWNVAGHRVAVAVKVSAPQLNRDGFATDVQRALQQSGLEPSLLALEIAETTVMLDKEGTTRRLQALKQLGVKIAVDDFGSGYAYRSDLQRMPIDFLKVDRASLSASEDEDYRSWLLEAILVFGKDLSLTVIAKGVESQEQVVALQAMGCTLAQGYFMGEPTPPESVPRLLGAEVVAQSPVALPAAPALGDSQ